ncbi:MAG: alkene reductase [Methylomonas sp.]|jgi:2,4-dienoyl-CoA reductase-like NADH-dependent reductase (Old Yellow Enzyme family)|uniref:alkene reductase n=1 Tax=Methylomonas sp. TaxID=418 RepID=UPI0025CF44A9|nr:alkene reductase [Methylomonas sp.]MCK9605416.1 alkene reductase [Methylomonas sp.]
MTNALLSPYTLHDLKLRNRVVLAPMTRARAGKERLANALMADYYSQRATAGLIITEATTISAQANGWNESPGIYTDHMAMAWRQVTDAVHGTGGTIFMQLWHCGRASHSSFHTGEPAVAPSAIAINGDYMHTPNGKEPYETPRALETEELPGIVDDYRRAAERARQAGFDGVEIHAANGYLLDEFLQSKTNQRSDRYGGSIANRYRLLGEVLAAVSTVWPSQRVGVRLSPNGVFNDVGSADYRAQFSYVAQQLDTLNLAYLHVMDGLAFGFHELGEAMSLTDFRQLFHGPLMGNCGYQQCSAEAAIASGNADLIAFGRPFISNPDLVERFARDAELNPIADMQDWYSPTGAAGYIDFPYLQN